MNKYSIDVKFTGFENIIVEADNVDDAIDMASEIFSTSHSNLPAQHLRNKRLEFDVLGEDRYEPEVG